MLPFLRRNHPDQWYRLFIPLFLHAGSFSNVCLFEYDYINFGLQINIDLMFYANFLFCRIIHCILTVFIQILYMRDLEKLLGWTRVAFLYMVSGIGGYLAGAIFVPYKVSKLRTVEQ